LSDSPELLKPNPEVIDSELQIEIGNLRAENESWRQRFAESQDTIEILNRGTEALNEQLAAANQAIAERDEKIIDKLEAMQPKNQRLQNDLGNLQAEIIELRSQLETERADREKIEAELSELKQNSAPATAHSQKLTPDVATILSQLRTRRKKSKTDLADLEMILEILES
jgi:chromosome segregation ATPase